MFIKNSEEFAFYQSLPSSTEAEHVAISANHSIVLNVGNGSIIYYARAVNGSYNVVQMINLTPAIEDVQICANENYMAVSNDNNYVNLYKKNSGTFSFLFSESCSAG